MKGLRGADLQELPQYDSGDARAPAENLDCFELACQRASGWRTAFCNDRRGPAVNQPTVKA
jgi:hypothetical protein